MVREHIPDNQPCEAASSCLKAGAPLRNVSWDDPGGTREVTYKYFSLLLMLAIFISANHWHVQIRRCSTYISTSATHIMCKYHASINLTIYVSAVISGIVVHGGDAEWQRPSERPLFKTLRLLLVQNYCIFLTRDHCLRRCHHLWPWNHWIIFKRANCSRRCFSICGRETTGWLKRDTAFESVSTSARMKPLDIFNETTVPNKRPPFKICLTFVNLRPPDASNARALLKMGPQHLHAPYRFTIWTWNHWIFFTRKHSSEHHFNIPDLETAGYLLRVKKQKKKKQWSRQGSTFHTMKPQDILVRFHCLSHCLRHRFSMCKLENTGYF